jgi:hypothetical protein
MSQDSRSVAKTIGLVAAAIVVSFAGAVVSIGLLPITPGAYVVAKVFPPRSVGTYALGPVLLVHMGTDFLFYFAILVGLYIWRVKAAARRMNDPK